MRAGSNSSLSLVILVRKPPNSHISPGCYTPLWLCALAGVYLRGGLPQFSLFCLFTYICRQKYVIGDGYYTCVPVRNLFQKRINLHSIKLYQKKNSIKELRIFSWNLSTYTCIWGRDPSFFFEINSWQEDKCNIHLQLHIFVDKCM